MSNNLPRKPVRFVPQNEELLKSQEGIAGQRKDGTDYSQDEAVGTISKPSATYRTPPDRNIGNVFFRRYVGGSLDYDYACHKIIDAIHRYKDTKDAHQLNNEEMTALGVLFPQVFTFVDNTIVNTIAAVQMRLAPEEVAMLRKKVAAHLAEEMNYNAGRGGGSVPGRHDTRS